MFVSRRCHRGIFDKVKYYAPTCLLSCPSSRYVTRSHVQFYSSWCAPARSFPQSASTTLQTPWPLIDPFQFLTKSFHAPVANLQGVHFPTFLVTGHRSLFSETRSFFVDPPSLLTNHIYFPANMRRSSISALTATPLIIIAATSLLSAPVVVAQEPCVANAGTGTDSLIAGNHYCSEVKAITYNKFPGHGSYNKVTKMDAATEQCESEPFSYSGSLSPLNEEVRMIRSTLPV